MCQQQHNFNPAKRKLGFFHSLNNGGQLATMKGCFFLGFFVSDLQHFLVVGTPPKKKTAGGPQNDGLEKVTLKFKHGVIVGIDMLDFWGVTI